MTTDDARRYKEGKVFLFIHASMDLKLPIKISEEREVKEVKKWLYGRITDTDRSMIAVTDNSGEVHLFKNSRVKECRPVALRRISWRMPKKFITKTNQ